MFRFRSKFSFVWFNKWNKTVAGGSMAWSTKDLYFWRGYDLLNFETIFATPTGRGAVIWAAPSKTGGMALTSIKLHTAKDLWPNLLKQIHWVKYIIIVSLHVGTSCHIRPSLRRSGIWLLKLTAFPLGHWTSGHVPFRRYLKVKFILKIITIVYLRTLLFVDPSQLFSLGVWQSPVLLPPLLIACVPLFICALAFAPT